MWERMDENWLRRLKKVESMVMAGWSIDVERCELSFGKFSSMDKYWNEE